jgi:hypothetical protein
MSFSKKFFNNLFRIYSSLFTNFFLIFYFIKKIEIEFLNSMHFE